MAKTCVTSMLAGLLLIGPATATSAQVHHVADMNTAEIKALDPAKTVVILPGGILEEHGPYLPAFADGYQNEWIVQRIGEAIVARPGWHVLIFPTIPLGVGGANEIGRKHVFPGTYAVRSSTLRAVFMDLATELGEQGFRWIFVVHAHGAPNHNRMLQQACDYFRDTYGGHMVHLSNTISGDEVKPSIVPTEAEQKEDGFSVHAGLWETSSVLFVRPDLVSPGLRSAASQTGTNWEDLIRLARAPEWPGYFGSPRLATAGYGAEGMSTSTKDMIALALKVLDGADERQLQHFSDFATKNEANIGIDRDALERERRVLRQQQEWLQKHPIANPDLNP